ncbi:MAG: hypothetical protein DMG80_16320 [Acidobacteria bacterium]|jgi:hypothetical protein|nr:MAG: hypothetical protein DMG80_16320 [Acidobacteriota bacterium]
MNLRLTSLIVLALSALPFAQVPKKRTEPSAKSAETAETIYRNSTFGFRYRIPYGWVERTKEMQEGDDASKGEVLLAAFERPPQAAGETINSAVVIASENAADYPGLKKAEDYLGPLTELTTSKGFRTEGDPAEVEIDSRRLVRVDFSRLLSEKLTMHQSTLVLLTKGQIISFTFIGDSADGVDDLIERLDFSSSGPKAK